ncbi:hypothetical protein GGI03_001244 [Coemansia sp. RSA 2337]|nr:hypothetical protein GGI08_001831 [Coemansia sp. S2]KAJ2075931.1 hypothetical protein GGH13_000264 [Coemansia sp. S155-1]KAJ2468014.1 hypothetical protein GGI03_001244 [Coemansia sp. RSA 2337]
MAPAASKIKISGYCFKWCLPEPAMPYFIQLVLKLCQSFKHIKYEIYCFDYKFTSQQVDKICDLVHLDYNIRDDCEEALQLARQNAPTLQSLVIYFSSVTDISSLIQDSDGSYAEYPFLRTLELRNDTGLGMSYDLESTLPRRSKRDISRLPVFAGAIPFPGLRRLCIRMDYPFGDDMLFRGNSATLEYLDLQLFPALIDRVKHHKVFTPVSHPRLWCVKIHQMDDFKLPNFETAEEYVRFALSVGPHAQVRMIDDLPYNADLIPIPPLFDGFTDIRTLSLSNTCPAFWDVVSLITRLPNLSYLCTNSPRFGWMPSGVTVRKLPAFVISKYAPMSERFRRWHFDYEYNCKPSEIARCVLLLALVCPNFDFINPHYYRHPWLMSHMKRVAGLQGFKDHTKRLLRLLTEP